MDTTCLDQGFFFDARDTNPLEAPETHSFHCLLDVGVCVDNGYEILADPISEDGLHCRAYTIEDNTKILEYARARGDSSCTTCIENEINQSHGLRVTIIGTMLQNGNVLVSEVLDEDAGCGDIPQSEPTCHAGKSKQSHLFGLFFGEANSYSDVGQNNRSSGISPWPY